MNEDKSIKKPEEITMSDFIPLRMRELVTQTISSNAYTDGNDVSVSVWVTNKSSPYIEFEEDLFTAKIVVICKVESDNSPTMYYLVKFIIDYRTKFKIPCYSYFGGAGPIKKYKEKMIEKLEDSTKNGDLHLAITDSLENIAYFNSSNYRNIKVGEKDGVKEDRED